MARLIYSALMSLDGYVNDETGNFDWAEPDETVHRFVNAQEVSIGTFLFGHRMYEVMKVWETLDADPNTPEYIREYAKQWRAAEKIVYSRSLTEASTARTRVEREFDAEAVRAMKDESAADLGIGGPTLAAEALRAGIVDEIQVYVAPVAVGGGLRFLPDHLRTDLTLIDEHRFANGTVFLRYAVQAR